MEKHYGEIVEHRVRKNGYSISDLAKNLKVNRRSIYNWFNQKHLKKEVIFHIGCILRYDFSKEFPELFTKKDFDRVLLTPQKLAHAEVNTLEDEIYKNKYVVLLEQYHKLLINSI